MIVFRKNKALWLVGLTAAVLLAGGCSRLQPRQENGQALSGQKDREGAARYDDFGDIMVPGELTKEPDNSFFYRSSGFSAGVLTLKGRVEAASLIGFFESNMARDNWQLMGSFKSPRTMMLFQKENRWCVIRITQGNYYTQAEIWAAPMIGEAEKAGSGLLK